MKNLLRFLMLAFIVLSVLAVVSSQLVDSDGDGIPDVLDNCPNVSNPDQSNSDVPAGLLLYWKFDQGIGATLSDYSGNGIEGAFKGNLAYTVDAKEGYAVETYGVNGVGGWATLNELDENFYFEQEASILAYVKIDAFDRDRFVWKLQYDLPDVGYPNTLEVSLNIRGKDLCLVAMNGLENGLPNSPFYEVKIDLSDPGSGFSLGQFNFLAVTVKNDDYKIYINETEAGSLAGPLFEVNDNAQCWWVGGADWSDYWLDGIIDEVAVYNKSLDEDQLFQHYFIGYADPFGDACDGCPSQNAAGLDANNDGCIDNTGNFSASVENLNLPKGTETALLSKIGSVDKALMKGNESAALSQLEALINFLNAQSGKKIFNKDADFLVRYAKSIIRRIQD